VWSAKVAACVVQLRDLFVVVSKDPGFSTTSTKLGPRGASQPRDDDTTMTPNATAHHVITFSYSSYIGVEDSQEHPSDKFQS
jgi:hypothetical protein